MASNWVVLYQLKWEKSRKIRAPILKKKKENGFVATISRLDHIGFRTPLHPRAVLFLE